MQQLVLLSLLLISTVLSDLTCTSNQVYVKFLKQSYSFASEESFEVWSGSQKLYGSPALVNNELRIIEYCLDASTNSQYTLKLKDSWGDSWTNGAYLEVQGIHGNTFFKNLMTQQGGDEYSLSLYYGINKNDQWKMTSSSISGTWTQYNYADSTWTQVTLGSVTTAVSGAQYFRKTFTGLANMAAYEASFNYKDGIVAYINGVEIYRDNMPSGPVSSSTAASGSYAIIDYHSVIRPGSEVASSQSVLAIEIHFTNMDTQNPVNFNSFLSILASSTLNQNCFVYPYNTTIAASFSTTNAKVLFDFYKTTSLSIATANLPATFTFTFTNVKAYFNGIYAYPYTGTSATTKSFVLEGTDNPLGDWTSVVTGNDVTYVSKEWTFVPGFFNAGLYDNYRFKVTSTATASIYEMQLLTCHSVVPTSIEFKQQTYNYYTISNDIDIRPITSEIVNCMITPTPATGLTFNAATCALTGKVSTAMSTTYTVSTTIAGQQLSGSFQLVVSDCTGTFVSILRTYKSYGVREAFSVIDASNQQTVFNVDISSGQVSSVDKDYLLCLPSAKYIIHTDSSVAYWQPASFLYVRGVFEDGVYDTMIRAKFDNNLGLPTSYTLNIQYNVKNNESWYYKMGEVPSNWFNSETSGWTSGTAGSYTASSNQIQLYKKTFNLSAVQNIAGVVISLKYQYGVLIYLNNHEVFRLGITGDLSTSSYSTTSQTEVAWRQISLPTRGVANGESSAANYIQQGSNTIAIALVAMNAAQTTSTFDCAVRIMGEEATSRVWDVTTSQSGITGSNTATANIMMFYYGYSITQSACTDNYWQIQFNNDRHEWISSIYIQLYYTQSTQQPRQFVIKAKNPSDSEWTTLKTVTGLSWSLKGENKRIWLSNSKAYNMYRLENIGTGISTACAWKISRIDLVSNPMMIDIPALSYESTSIYKDIEMGEVYPNSEYYTDFTINPALPTGVSIDHSTGVISGTASTLQNPVTYTISAKKITGETVTAQFTLTIEVCHGGKNLITLVARTDSSPGEASYKLYQGKGTSGSIVKQISAFSIASNLNYGDFCLNHGIYTLELRDTSTGWNVPAGYYLTVDVGEMKFEMGQVYSTPSPASVTTMFSSLLPFQIEYDDWKVYTNTQSVASNWNAIDFDDASWTVCKAAQIGTSEAVTVYIRREVNIPDIADYHVLNVRVKYTGGIVAYFNGRKVARFNLEENFNSNTESIEVHDSTIFSKFHIVLPTVGAVTGKNVIAFEVHRPTGQSSAEPIVFDATGVFGVNDCSIGVDSFIDVTGTPGTTIGDLANFFDLTPVTYGYQPNVVGTFLQWTIENLEGTRFNSFALQTVYARTSWAFSLYGREKAYANNDPEAEEYTSMFADVNLSTVNRGRVAWPVPVGIASFRQFRWEVDDAASSTVTISAYIFQYCKPSGTGSCPAIDDYPSVGEGEISPASCGYGFRGYSYRECHNGQLSEIKMDKCIYKIPDNLLYDSERYTLVLNTQVSIAAPTYDNIITKFYLAENTFLPDGLTLDETTGAITGVPTSESGIKSFTIYGENPKGVINTVVNISVRKGECKADGKFPKTQVDEIATYECALGGSYVGTQKRACLLGPKDGEWQKIQGTCVATSMIIIIVLVIIIIVVIVVFFIVRSNKKAKAVGGVKGKKSTKSTASKKGGDKKPSTKSVKV